MKLVNSDKSAHLAKPILVDQKLHHNAIREIMASDKVKYQKALALQKLNRDPDEIFSSIKHHLAWNVRHRKPLFDQSGKYFDEVCDIFLKAGQLADVTAHLLWLAPDHIHLYVESDGTKSLEKIAQTLKRYSNLNILKIFPGLKSKTGSRSMIWDKAYFCETLG